MPNKRFLQGARALLPRRGARRILDEPHLVPDAARGGEDQQIQTPQLKLIDKFALKGPRLLARLATRVVPVAITEDTINDWYSRRWDTSGENRFNGVVSVAPAAGAKILLETGIVAGAYDVSLLVAHDSATPQAFSFRLEDAAGTVFRFASWSQLANTPFQPTFRVIADGARISQFALQVVNAFGVGENARGWIQLRRLW